MIYQLLGRLALWAHWHRIDWLGDAIYRVTCPYPLIPNHSARACIAAGLCGCDNKPKGREARNV